MLQAAALALSQILSPPLRAILWKSIGLALVLIVVIAVALQRFLAWLVTAGEGWAEYAVGPTWDTPLTLLAWILSIAAGLGIIFGSVLLMPAVTSFVASFFVDEVAEQIERESYPTDPIGHAVPISIAIWEGGKTALLAILLYIVALPLLFFAGVGAVVFFLVSAHLLSREYFELAAMRFHSPDEAKRLRKIHQGRVFTAGLLIALFVSIPIVNLATPIFGMALMVHLHKQLTRAPAPTGRAARITAWD